MKDDLQTIGAAIGRIPSGCAVLTAEHGGDALGMLISWLQQASFQPPAVSVCLKHGRPAAKLIDRSGRFLVNLLGEDSSALFKHFAGGFSEEENAFEGLPIRSTEYGPLIESCIAHLGCEVRGKLSAGDHDVYIGEVRCGGATPDARPYVHVRKSGLSY